MVLSEICIRRPVFASVLSLIIVLIGLISYTRLSVREYPKIDEPIVSVDTTYKGASPEVIESQVTKPLEDQLAGIEGVDVMTSRSRSERSLINIKFSLSRDPDAAAAEVRDKVSRARRFLPDEIDEPIIGKVEADSQPIIYIAVESGSYSAIQTSDYINRYIKTRLSVLPGAAEVRVFGERLPSMRIYVDRDKLAAYGLTVQDVEAALRSQNVEIPAGRIESRAREFSVVSSTDLQTPAQFEDVVVANVKGYPVRLRDVAKVEIGAANDRVLSRYNGRSAINIGLTRQSTANPLELSKAVRAEIVQLNQSLPAGMKLNIAYDSSVFIERSIDSVFKTIGEAIILVVLVIFFFLRNLRASIIPIVTIPVSLVGACALMYLFGFSINTLTLLAMVLAIGLVVDDAIVVLENIFRHIEEGMPRKQAAFQGSREIGFAVVAMTLTLVTVYAPLAFATGRTGRLFIEFALALAGAVLVSGFVALTLTPMMCSVLLRHQHSHNRWYNLIEGWLEALGRGYRRALELALRHRWTVVGVGAVVAAASGVLFSVVKSELAPIEDRGVVFGIVSAPEGATLNYTLDSMLGIEQFYAAIPEAATAQVTVGFPTVTDGTAILRLTPWEERTRRQQQIAQELQPKFASLPGVRVFPTNPPSLGQSARSKPVEFIIMSQASYPELAKLVGVFTNALRDYPGLQNIDTDLRLNTPELRVHVDRDKMADVGASVEVVGRTLESMLGGRQVTRYKDQGEQYDVIVQVVQGDRATPADISGIYVRARDGSMVQLDNLLSVRESVSPQSLNHFNRLRAVKVDAAVAPGYALGEVLDHMHRVARDVLPNTVITDLDGQSREFRDSSGSIYLVFAMALAFIYLVLAAQFESWRNPFIIMLSVPLSMTGALLALWLTGGTLSIYSQIGLITLVGLITKHGILIVEFANQLRDQGKAMHEAVVEASVLRLRPILMTTGAMVLGTVPLALAQGAGAESRQQIGWVLVGGLMLGTLLTLFVVPVAYSMIAAARPQGQRTGASHTGPAVAPPASE
ncbi:efflux RND transporter permease subunit [Bordetella parapertussis]|uniref:Efflux RND transporter permease subunit n=2 Tax=Bordetella parapertussis TaxID=519 RepID=A0ABU5X625_BORPP|nr:efflux RND transporter permease subunit [Bordetella parapertussis]AOB40751.1 multidrug transporter AcrB [Bordetella parapertussis]AUL44789.1 multidrug transporter AcrB [Bordetella parapertussis]AWP64689.1 multidrug transporter AcrB [Bordetella parapertussis]AWP72194.1 multidrug transporter AcrB [Bordetella parapertussis]AWP90796.1 multidrug transporter AcrB [Bordetella parapertussis]